MSGLSVYSRLPPGNLVLVLATPLTNFRKWTTDYGVDFDKRVPVPEELVVEADELFGVGWYSVVLDFFIEEDVVVAVIAWTITARVDSAACRVLPVCLASHVQLWNIKFD